MTTSHSKSDANGSTDSQPSADVSVKDGVVRVRFKKAFAKTVVAGLIGLAGLGGYKGLTSQDSIETRVSRVEEKTTRVEEKQVAQEKEVYYAREDIRALMRAQGAERLITTPPPKVPPPTTEPK